MSLSHLSTATGQWSFEPIEARIDLNVFAALERESGGEREREREREVEIRIKIETKIRQFGLLCGNFSLMLFAVGCATL